jgi:topoisomerase IA-like protein
MERALGDHPDKGGAVTVKSGRYGHYVSHDGLNAAIPKDAAPEAITLAEALPLLAARALLNGGAKPRRVTKERPTVRAMPEKEEGSPEKKFADKLQSAIEHLLEIDLEPKDANAAIANGVRLLMAQLKMAGDEGDGFWGND